MTKKFLLLNMDGIRIANPDLIDENQLKIVDKVFYRKNIF